VLTLSLTPLRLAMIINEDAAILQYSLGATNLRVRANDQLLITGMSLTASDLGTQRKLPPTTMSRSKAIYSFSTMSATTFADITEFALVVGVFRKNGAKGVGASADIPRGVNLARVRSD
jgi:hypothetical protein